MLFHSGEGEVRDEAKACTTGVVTMFVSFDGLIEVRSRAIRQTIATTVPMRRAALATKTMCCDATMLNFDHKLFGFNTDREDGYSKRKCRRINPGFAYPRWQNSLARGEQIVIELAQRVEVARKAWLLLRKRVLPLIPRAILFNARATAWVGQHHFFQPVRFTRPLFISTLRSNGRACAPLD